MPPMIKAMVDDKAKAMEEKIAISEHPELGIREAASHGTDVSRRAPRPPRVRRICRLLLYFFSSTSKNQARSQDLSDLGH